MDPVWCILLAPFCAAVTGGLVYFVMESRVEVRLARQREKLAAARATLRARTEAMAALLHGARESAHREAMEKFLGDIFVEERHYIRECGASSPARKCIVRQERIFFGNLPLSNWIEKEMPFEEGADLDHLASTMAIFDPDARRADVQSKPLKLIRNSRASLRTDTRRQELAAPRVSGRIGCD